MKNDSKNSINDAFFDTSILVYAYDKSEVEKQAIASELVRKAFNGELKGFISNQILSELYFVLIGKKGVEKSDAEVIVLSFVESDRWIKLNYDTLTVKSAVKSSNSINALFWDILITETMRENGINKIITEDEDFNKIPGIEIINPFKKL